MARQGALFSEEFLRQLEQEVGQGFFGRVIDDVGRGFAGAGIESHVQGPFCLK